LCLRGVTDPSPAAINGREKRVKLREKRH